MKGSRWEIVITVVLILLVIAMAIAGKIAADNAVLVL